MSPVLDPPEQTTQRVILRRVSWETYERLLAEHEQCSSPRFTYDRGVLEIMSPSIRHERLNRSIATMCEVIAEELHIELDNAGSTTFKRADLTRGFEPDSCFYVQNVERVRGRDQIDLTVDPPPDLVIEIDLSRSSLDRFPIFASIGVPEVWRYDGTRLTIFILRAGNIPGTGGKCSVPWCDESDHLPVHGREHNNATHGMVAPGVCLGTPTKTGRSQVTLITPCLGGCACILIRTSSTT